MSSILHLELFVAVLAPECVDSHSDNVLTQIIHEFPGRLEKSKEFLTEVTETSTETTERSPRCSLWTLWSSGSRIPMP